MMWEISDLSRWIWYTRRIYLICSSVHFLFSPKIFYMCVGITMGWTTWVNSLCFLIISPRSLSWEWLQYQPVSCALSFVVSHVLYSLSCVNRSPASPAIWQDCWYLGHERCTYPSWGKEGDMWHFIVFKRDFVDCTSLRVPHICCECMTVGCMVMISSDTW